MVSVTPVEWKPEWCPGGGVLLSEKLMEICRWMGWHFHAWIDYNQVTFFVELPEWGRTFSKFLG